MGNAVQKRPPVSVCFVIICLPFSTDVFAELL